jgi:hypothetical protein
MALIAAISVNNSNYENGVFTPLICTDDNSNIGEICVVAAFWRSCLNTDLGIVTWNLQCQYGYYCSNWNNCIIGPYIDSTLKLGIFIPYVDRESWGFGFNSNYAGSVTLHWSSTVFCACGICIDEFNQNVTYQLDAQTSGNSGLDRFIIFACNNPAVSVVYPSILATQIRNNVNQSDTYCLSGADSNTPNRLLHFYTTNIRGSVTNCLCGWNRENYPFCEFSFASTPGQYVIQRCTTSNTTYALKPARYSCIVGGVTSVFTTETCFYYTTAQIASKGITGCFQDCVWDDLNVCVGYLSAIFGDANINYSCTQVYCGRGYSPIKNTIRTTCPSNDGVIVSNSQNCTWFVFENCTVFCCFHKLEGLTCMFTPTPPGPPTLSTPSDGATGISQTGNITWQQYNPDRFRCASSYCYQVSTNATFSPTLCANATTTDTFYTYTLGAPHTYYWRVGTRNAGGCCFSTCRTFTTAVPGFPHIGLTSGIMAQSAATENGNMVLCSGTLNYRTATECSTESITLDNGILKRGC